VEEVAAEAVGERLVECLLARVAEGGVAEVVTEADRLGEVLVQAECSGDRARDPGGLEGVREARAVMVALRVDEDLRLVLEPAEALRVDDAVAVALERGAQAALVFLVVLATGGLVGADGERGQPRILVLANASGEGVRNRSRDLGHSFQR
jgi:hypothetical protein